MASTLPERSKVVLWKLQNGWVPFVTYPSGHPTVLPLDGRSKPDLSAAYEYLKKHHSDETIERGHEAVADPSGGRPNIPPGSIVFLEKHSDGWAIWVSYAAGGISGTMSHYKSLGTALELLKLNYDVQ